MGYPDDLEPTPERGDSTPERSIARRRRTIAGVTGAAALLAAGGVLLVTQTRDSQQESLPEPPPLAAAGETAPEAPVPEGSASADAVTPSTAASAAPASSPASTSGPGKEPAAKKRSEKEVREEIDKARAQAKADGVELQRPLQAKGGAAAKADEAVTQRTESIKDGSVRVTTARHDLTDSAALLIAGDGGKSVGDGVKCTNRVRFSQDTPATERPTLLVCWRTSANRSVVTMMATPRGIPSADANVSIINREWAKLA